MRTSSLKSCSFPLVFISFLPFKILIGIYLLSNFVLVSAVQQSESVVHINKFLFLGFPSLLDSHRVLSRFPCAIQKVLISYVFYT